MFFIKLKEILRWQLLESLAHVSVIFGDTNIGFKCQKLFFFKKNFIL
jgi:hypothetical protein